MIGLQTALLLAGLVAFIVVLIVSYDKYRLFKIQGRESQLRGDDQQEPALVPRSEFRVEPDPPQTTDQIVISPPPEPELKPEFLPPGAGPQEQPSNQVVAGFPAVNVPPAQTPESQPTEASAEAESEPTMEQEAPEPAPGPDARLSAELREVEQMANTPINGVSKTGARDASPPDGLQIEFVARLPGKNVIKRDTALGLYRQYEFDLKKSHRILGLSHPARVWCDLERQPEAARFTDFGMTLQLADSRGPATESELNQFSQMVLRFAEVFGRRFKFSSTFEEAIEQAKTLDGLCKKYDALAILNIVTRDAMFRGTAIDRHARELGMQLNQRHFFQKSRAINGKGQHLYSLANLHGNGEFNNDALERFATSGITLFMNIPCTRDPAQVFNEMVVDAKELCKRLDGKLVDQNQRGMTQKGLKRISQEIRQLAQDMEQEGIVPGGELALRLF